MDRALSPLFWGLAQDTDTETGPPRKPARAPVFIHDAITPWGAETMLLKVLRDQAADHEV